MSNPHQYKSHKWGFKIQSKMMIGSRKQKAKKILLSNPHQHKYHKWGFKIQSKMMRGCSKNNKPRNCPWVIPTSTNPSHVQCFINSVINKELI